MMNPVLRREVTTTFRGWKNYGVVAFYLAMVTLGAGIFLYASINGSYDFSFDPRSMVYLYIILAAIQMALIMFAVPALTAGSISGERERQTLDLLLVTKMSPLSIVGGKLMSSMAFLLLLFFGTLPIFAIVFYFGGVSILSLLQMMAFALTTSFMLGGISIFFSCFFKRTVISIMLVYIVSGFLCFGTILMVFVPMVVNNNYSLPSLWELIIKLIPNPGVGFFSLIDHQLGTGILQDAFYYSTLSEEEHTVAFWVYSNFWMVHMLFQILVGGLFTFLAAGRINPSVERQRRVKQ